MARALKLLGESPVVTGWIGGYAGQFIEDGLQAEGIQTDFIHTAFESRTCLSILDPTNHTLTELYEKGDAVPIEKVAEFAAWFRSHVNDYEAVTFSGSLPPGVPLSFYRDMIEMAREGLQRELRVIAEGVETPAQYRFLQKQGCEEAQGFYIGKPMTAAALKDWWEQRMEYAMRLKEEHALSGWMERHPG